MAKIKKINFETLNKITLETLLNQATNIDIESTQFSYIKKNKNIIILKQASDYSKKLDTRIQQFKLEIADLKTSFTAMPHTEKLKLSSEFEINSDKQKELKHQAIDKQEEKNQLEETIAHMEGRLLELISHWKLNVRLRFPILKLQPKIYINQDGNICYNKSAGIEFSEIVELLFQAVNRKEPDFNDDIPEGDIPED